MNTKDFTIPLSLNNPEQIRDYLAHTVCDSNATDELRAYVNNAFTRFMLTLDYLPQTQGQVLELGATPYFLTVLMKRFRPGYQLELANFFGDDVTDASILHPWHIENTKYDEYYDIHFRQFNVERQAFPYADGSFDGVLFCEIIEHLTVDPAAALFEIHRVLKPGGWVVVTTPNIASYYNILKLWRGENISDGYSGYGAYGRHNHEYTLNDLRRLLEAVGYQVERIQAHALSQLPFSLRVALFRRLRPATQFEEHLFCLARKVGPLQKVRPNWLYNSLPPESQDKSITVEGSNMSEEKQEIIIRDPQVDAQAVIAQVEQTVQWRQAQAAAQDADYEAFVTDLYTARSDDAIADTLQNSLQLANETWANMRVSLSLTPSCIPLLGGFVQRIRAALHNLVIYYVNMLGQQQIAFNQHVMQTLNLLAESRSQERVNPAQTPAPLALADSLPTAALRLPVAPAQPSQFSRRLCKVCDIHDWKGEAWLGILQDLGENPYQHHRKAWEWVQGIYGLQQLGLLRPDAVALGVGAGREVVLYYLANHIQHVYATDIYGEGTFVTETAPAEMLTHPAKFAPFPYQESHLTAQYMDGRHLKFPDNYFDFVFSFSSIEHFGGHAAAAESLREMARVVKPGGVIMVTTELILNGQPDPNGELFLPEALQEYVIQASGLHLIEEVDYTLSPETLARPVDFERPGYIYQRPHIICKLGSVYWTSVCIFFQKEMSDVSS